MKSINILSY